jgi:rhodanese-related sulfurtransferase
VNTYRTWKPLSAVFLCLYIVFGLCGIVAGQSYQKITKEDAKEIIGKNGVVTFDVRETRDWESSKFKIKSALRVDLKKTKLADLNLPKDITVIFY